MAGYPYPGQYTTYGAYPPQQLPGAACSPYGQITPNIPQQAATPQQPLQSVYAYQQVPQAPHPSSAVLNESPCGYGPGCRPPPPPARPGLLDVLRGPPEYYHHHLSSPPGPPTILGGPAPHHQGGPPDGRSAFGGAPSQTGRQHLSGFR
ncbi:hypothetical protein LSCM1_01383 [Leishmania martiniquensis]|uniref:Uncharacterized protein n=1 Tax=Leishmania martiniquensis TaxID=1580590 RepID=A0A836KES9_9TRYP|nr:hypothetical protein LSCM1_01383 [Leishmania martiniquensis]